MASQHNALLFIVRDTNFVTFLNKETHSVLEWNRYVKKLGSRIVLASLLRNGSKTPTTLLAPVGHVPAVCHVARGPAGQDLPPVWGLVGEKLLQERGKAG